MTQIITSVTTVLGVLIMMVSISWMMTLVALVILPLSGLFITLVVKNSQKYFKQQQDYLGHVNGHVEEMYGSHVVMKAFNGEKRSVEKFDGYNGTLYNAAWKSQFLSGLMMPVMMFIGNLGYVGVAILGGYLAIRGTILPLATFRLSSSTCVRSPNPSRRSPIFPMCCSKRLPQLSGCSNSWKRKKKSLKPKSPDPTHESGWFGGIQRCAFWLQPGKNHHQ